MWREKLSVEKYQKLLDFSTAISQACARRSYIATSEKLVRLGYPSIRVRDIIIILYGCTMPYIMRPRRDRTIEFVGDCYIHGLMNREELLREQRNKDETFRIT